MVKEDVETVVNRINEIDSKINLLSQEKVKITSEYYVELLEHDLETISDVLGVLEELKTEKATKSVEENEVVTYLLDVSSDIEEEIERVKKTVDKYKRS